MGKINPIQTEYNGYLFRSRLEARWAVFFDEAGIDYQYEPEGFELEDGTRYLPDFYLPWFKCFVEIKNRNISKDVESTARKKLEKLFLLGDCCVMLCKGDPLDESIEVLCSEYDEGGGSLFVWNSACFTMGAWFNERSGGKRWIDLMLDYRTTKSDVTFTAYNVWEDGSYIPLQASAYCTDPGYDLAFAKKAARKARFEYGETPKAKRRTTKIRGGARKWR